MTEDVDGRRRSPASAMHLAEFQEALIQAELEAVTVDDGTLPSDERDREEVVAGGAENYRIGTAEQLPRSPMKTIDPN